MRGASIYIIQRWCINLFLPGWQKPGTRTNKQNIAENNSPKIKNLGGSTRAPWGPCSVAAKQETGEALSSKQQNEIDAGVVSNQV